MFTLRFFPFLLLFLLVGVGCDSDNGDAPPPSSANVPSLVRAQSDTDVPGTFNRLSQTIQTNPLVDFVAAVNHSTNAQNAGLTLRPMRVVLAGNPVADTPILQANQVAGIDVPQRLLVYEAADGSVFAAYDDPEYLAQRHGVGAVATLGQIRNVLRSSAQAGTNGTVSDPGVGTISLNQGLVSAESNFNAETTYTRLRAAIEANATLTIVAEVSHDANAKAIGEDLRPTRVIVFGNPALGTPLMQSSQTTGLDLPQKMLVYTDATGSTFVVFNDPAYVAARHGASGVNDEIGQIRTALQGLAATATGN